MTFIVLSLGKKKAYFWSQLEKNGVKHEKEFYIPLSFPEVT